MRLPLSFTAALLLLSGIATADAADTTLLAATAGFLLGNAHRCNIPAERIVRASQVIRDMIRAAAQNVDEETGADARFAEAFSSSAYPDANSESLVPSCAAVSMQFQRLERHHQQAGFTD
ncbi:MAG: hypothetical protein WA633_23810 [Stellaceae bacterium]